MICRNLYAHKGSILLNSGRDHSKPRGWFLLRVFSGEDLVCYSCGAWCCVGQEPDGTETPYKKRRFAARAQTLNAHCFVLFASFAALKNKCHSIPRGGSTAAVSGRTGEMCGLWACCKIRLENHRQLGIKKKKKKKTNAKWWHQR